jgi:4-amino-4-deoxy-L-arabinose transferase-like glycosyltransferase
LTAYHEDPASTRTHWCLAAVLLIAAAARIHGLAFGLPALYDPDEPLFVLNAIKLIHDQTLNPGWFGHPGTTTLYGLAFVDLAVFATGLVTGQWVDGPSFARAIYGNAALIWLPNRGFILLCGMACVWLTYRLGRRLFGPATGLVAALLLALDPLHIKYSQIIRTDVQATAFILLGVLASIGIARQGTRRSYVAAGIWLGLAVATKWPSGLVVVVIAGACLTRITDGGDRRVQLRRLVLAGAAGLAALVAASPFLVLDYPAVVRDLTAEARPYHLGATGHGFVRNAGWYVTTCLWPAFGPAGLVLALAGSVLAAARSRFFALALAPFVAVYFVVISTQALIWDRWSVPLLPFLSVAAAVAVVAAYRRVRAVAAGAAPFAAAAGALLVAAPLVAATVARANERVHDTRRASTAWIRANVPPGSRVMAEYLALDLLNRGWKMQFPVGDGGCVDVDANVNAHIDYAKIDRWRGNRPIIDFGTMNPATVPACLADYAVLVDYDRYLAEEDSFRYVQEISNYRRLIASGTVVATIAPQAGLRGGPVVRIVKLSGVPR